jgi:Domain of unknown function (DUF4328)
MELERLELKNQAVGGSAGCFFVPGLKYYRQRTRSQPPSALTMNREKPYRSAWWLALLFTLLSVASAIIHLVGVQITTLAIGFLDSVKYLENTSLEHAAAIDSRQRLVAIIQLMVILFEVILFLMWVYRANQNARALGAQDMEYTPGWSVAWFLSPITNLFMPYFVVKEIWQASTLTPAAKWKQTLVSPFLSLWWLVTAFSGMVQYTRWHYLTSKGPTTFAVKFLSQGSNHLSYVDSELERNWGLITNDIAGIAVCILTIVVVLIITKMQGRKHAMTSELESHQEEPFMTPDTVNV